MNDNSGKIQNEGYLKERFHYFHLRDTAGQERDFHFHEFNKLVILISGHVDYAVENNLYALRSGDVLLVRHHAIHKAIIDKSEPYERIIIYIDEAYFSGVMPEVRLTGAFARADKAGQYLLRPAGEEKDAVSALLQRYEAVGGEGILSDAMRETVVMQLLIFINSMTAAIPAEKSEKTDRRIEAVLTYIGANLTSPLDAEDLAGRVYLSKYHFMRLFRESTGYTVHDYIRQQRLLYASRLIREGMPATDAASESGFGDYSVFYRAFRSLFGVSPGSLCREKNGKAEFSEEEKSFKM